MNYLDEFEYQYSKENTLKTAGEIYEWIKSKNRKGQHSDFTNLLTNHIVGLSDFLENNDEKIKDLKHKSIKRKKTKSNETAIRFKAEKFFALHSSEKKEKFRRKWNNRQREIWWDHF